MENAIKEIGLKFAQVSIDLAIANSTIQDLQQQLSELKQKKEGNENESN